MFLLTSGMSQAAPPTLTPLPAKASATTEALVYSTMPSTAAHRPEMAMDSDSSTYFKSAYGMSDGDVFLVLLSQPLLVRSLRITTGTAENDDLLTDGIVDVSGDGISFTRAADFNTAGVAETKIPDNTPVLALRIRLNQRRSIPALLIREISINAPGGGGGAITHVEAGPGRGFADISQAPDVADWAQRAEKQMEAFWPDTAALLYSDKFITPNMINVVYRTGPNVTAVAATGGGVMTVNAKWCREHPEDTGLTVHEMAHVVQSMSAYNPVWLIEGIADYIRWVKFEPENHHPRLNVQTATYHDSYRTTATFLAWCELHYDSALVTKLNRAIRAGRYQNAMFAQLCGKDVDTLWSEFIAAYKADPVNVITPTIAAADRPRVLPSVKAGSSLPVDLSSAFSSKGIYKDGASFDTAGGLDSGGAAYSAAFLPAALVVKDIRFQIGAPGRTAAATAPDVVTCRGNVVPLPAGNYASLWLLGTGIEGSQMAQSFTVTYTDGSTDRLVQNMSDWFQPQSFPGETRALKMPYRNLADGSRDPRTFYAYTYGAALNSAKTVKSITLPTNDNVKLLSITLAN